MTTQNLLNREVHLIYDIIDGNLSRNVARAAIQNLLVRFTEYHVKEFAKQMDIGIEYYEDYLEKIN